MNEFHALFLSDIRRRLFQENEERIYTCLNLITEDQLWYKHNENVNSIGNLILHLCGNITQYICSGILRENDLRNRDSEFDQSNTYKIQQIKEHLGKTMSNIKDKLDLITPEMLTKNYEVQGFQENGISILVHVTEHFSYHVGQITYITKYLNNVDTSYYGGLDLNAKSS